MTISKEEEKLREKTKFMFRYNGAFIASWEIFIILVAIINSITIPFQVFYQDWTLSYLNSDAFNILDAIID